ncbi:hypothetical protein RDWZM_004234 [Blomia tropicalis]|uniref:Uncharacterized protein n=1 Tax=Blomia tropicalis TaxID=40697 RepID=A0A9Q0MH34_BLOTA|nr:hypothetical protein RDWZM_004234 [Blomia tropicalis]
MSIQEDESELEEVVLNETEKEFQNLTYILMKHQCMDKPPTGGPKPTTVQTTSQPSNVNDYEPTLRQLKPFFREWLEIKYSFDEMITNNGGRKNGLPKAELEPIHHRCRALREMLKTFKLNDQHCEQLQSFKNWLSSQNDSLQKEIEKSVK